MKQNGFQLRKLRVGGPGVEPAEVPFESGLNVISGASDTGKSYIFQCINFMLGGGKVPKTFTKNEGYTYALLEIESASGQRLTLQRSLEGGAFTLFRSSISDLSKDVLKEILKERHEKGNSNSLSAFLLALTGIENKKVLKNAHSQTRSFSFRDLVPFLLIGETEIISDNSLILSGEPTEKTGEVSAFNFLLTGKDSGDLVANKNEKEQRASKAGRIELIETLILEVEDRIKRIKEDLGPRDIDVESVDSRIAELFKNISEGSKLIARQMQIRKEAWDEEQTKRSRRIVLQELMTRFDLLKGYYEADIKRLEFVNEADHYFSQLVAVACPHCGQSIDSHKLQQICSSQAGNDSPVNISRASQIESQKIKVLLADLHQTMEQMQAEIASLTSEIQFANSKVKDSESIIAGQLEPNNTVSKKELAQLSLVQQKLRELYVYQRQLAEYFATKQSLEAEKTQKGTAAATVDRRSLVKLCSEISALLKAWRFPKSDQVEFDTTALDIVISGEPRMSFGKGYRAIARSAFNIALMRYCHSSDKLAHPGFVILDSPLTTYKGSSLPVQREEASEDVQSAFFATLSEWPSEEQIIVLENKEPDLEVTKKINYIFFSGAEDVGRQGFFPKKSYI